MAALTLIFGIIGLWAAVPQSLWSADAPSNLFVPPSPQTGAFDDANSRIPQAPSSASSTDSANSPTAEGARPMISGGNLRVKKDKFTLGGFFYNEFYSMYHEDNQEMRWGSYTKLRTKATWELNPSVKVHTELLYQAIYGELNSYNLFQRWGMMTQDDQALLSGAGMLGIDLHQSLLIDQAYLSIKDSGIHLQAGKQIIGWGTGYFFNPTDRVNNLSLLDPAAEFLGTLAMAYSFNLWQDTSLNGYFALEDRSHKKIPLGEEDKFDNIGYGIKFQTHLIGYDMSLSFIHEVFHDSMYDLISYPEGRTIHNNYLGLDFAGEIWVLGFYGELAYQLPNEREYHNQQWDERQLDGLLGIDYTFTFGVDFRLEYYYQGDGQGYPADYNILDTLSAKRIVMGMHYLLLNVNFTEIADFVTLSLFGLVNLNDRSVFILPELVWNPFTDTEIRLGFYLKAGDKGDEFDGRYTITQVDPTTGMPFQQEIATIFQTVFLRFRVYF